jgi:hypothetical protein
MQLCSQPKATPNSQIKIMKYSACLIFFLVLPVCCSSVHAQSTSDVEAINEVIRKLFKGMELGDSSMVSETFTKNATIVIVASAENSEAILQQKSDALKGFLKAVGTPHSGKWYEEVWNIKTDIDGHFAQLWCDYAFYRGKKFSHCGADAFHLYKSKEGWKIFHLAYSLRNTDCNIPDEIKSKRQ